MTLQLPRPFEHGRLVASRNGRVVVELRREARAHGLTLSVCNPMTGYVSVLPPLYGSDCPGTYACVILTGEDLDVPAPSDFFRVLLVYTRGGFTALRSCSSPAAGWGPEERKPGVKMDAHMLRGMGQAVVVGGVAYWPMRRQAFGVRLDGAPSEPMDVCSVPYRPEQLSYGEHVLGTSPDGKCLSFVSMSFMTTQERKASILCVEIETQTAAGGEWEGSEHALLIKQPEIVVTGAAARLWWFGERSGTVLFTVGAGTSQRVYMLNITENHYLNNRGPGERNITTGSAQRLADGVECHAWKYLCGYEMDREALLASVARL